MTALITLSHGSRHSLAEPGIRRLTRAAAGELGVEAMAAHLDFSSPTLQEAAVRLAGEGVTRAIVVPLLFTHAYHAKYDVPAALEEARAASGLKLALTPCLGTGSDVAQVLIERVRTDAPAGAHLVLYSVGSSDTDANQAVFDLAHEVGAATGRTIEVIPATGGQGIGGAALVETAVRHRRIHLLPLFVTEGLLLQRVTDQFPHIEEATGTTLTASAPLETALTGVVARRHRDALAGFLSHA